MLADHVQLFQDCTAVAQVLYPAAACPAAADNAAGMHLPLRYPLHLLWNAEESSATASDENKMFLTHTAWHLDAETGRGAILVTTGDRHGRVWRWETGGGPIPIGRTLVLDAAGCRTSACVDNNINNKLLIIN